MFRLETTRPIMLQLLLAIVIICDVSVCLFVCFLIITLADKIMDLLDDRFIANVDYYLSTGLHSTDHGELWLLLYRSSSLFIVLPSFVIAIASLIHFKRTRGLILIKNVR